MTPSLQEHAAEHEIPVHTPAPSAIRDQEHDTQSLNEYQEASTLGGDTECKSDNETVDGRNSKATSAWNLEKESLAQSQLGPLPAGPARAETENVSGDRPLKDTHATVGDSFTHRLEPDTRHREAGDGRLGLLL
ncbi:hypothetical protein AJ78_02248 [Emergomyces pasteurianus Ep9510]|uniref:Uncharacterized protein n=1 Tax=Emergomyces pasteurianus Ep9510 TaxID=1447872 RepID=A0A1J9PMJ3_9EURO|nr:hypothetical protein AJ78_02248 [Emergomyces pasteurianus Ep9510]